MLAVQGCEDFSKFSLISNRKAMAVIHFLEKVRRGIKLIAYLLLLALKSLSQLLIPVVVVDLLEPLIFMDQRQCLALFVGLMLHK